MIYLLYGQESFLINKKVKDIILENHIEDFNVINYDLNDTFIQNVIVDAETMSLFMTKKLIIVDNAHIFTGATAREEDKIETLLRYYNNPNENTIIVFIVRNDKLDERKKIVKIMRQNFDLKELNCSNIYTVIKSMLGKYKMDNSTINLLVDRVGNDLELLNSEIEKIKIYKNDDLSITKEDVTNLTTKNIEIDIFALVNAVISKNIKKAIEIYHEMLKHNEEPVKIIVTLANQLRLIYQSKELYKKGYTEKDITNLYKIHPYRVQIALKNSYQYNGDELLNYLKQLTDLDLDIKTGKVDKEVAFELFILKLH